MFAARNRSTPNNGLKVSDGKNEQILTILLIAGKDVGQVQMLGGFGKLVRPKKRQDVTSKRRRSQAGFTGWSLPNLTCTEFRQRFPEDLVVTRLMLQLGIHCSSMSRLAESREQRCPCLRRNPHAH